MRLNDIQDMSDIATGLASSAVFVVVVYIWEVSNLLLVVLVSGVSFSVVSAVVLVVLVTTESNFPIDDTVSAVIVNICVFLLKSLHSGPNVRVKMVEVKGPGDRLSDRQIAWLGQLIRWGADVEVCYLSERV